MAVTPPDRLASQAQVWRDHDGSVAAYGFTESGRHAMTFPHLGAFRFTPTAGEAVEAEIRLGVEDEIVQDAYRRMVVPMVLQARGLEALHSSAVVMGRSILALCGTSHSGKSTLAYALARRDHTLWADDSVAFELAGEEVMAVPLPSRIRLRPESLDYFRQAGELDHLEAAREVRARFGAPAPLGGVVVLEPRNQSAEAAIRSLPPAVAFPLALEHAFCFSLDDPVRKRRMMRNYLELVRRVPMYEARLPAGLGHMERTVDLLEAAAAETKGPLRTRVHGEAKKRSF